MEKQKTGEVYHYNDTGCLCKSSSYVEQEVVTTEEEVVELTQNEAN